MITTIGLVLIVCAWAYQYRHMMKKHREVTHVFAGLYALGVLALLIGGWNAGGNAAIWWLNLITGLIALGVFMMVRKGK